LFPQFNHSNVLPPYVGADSTAAAQTSPYVVSFDEFARRLATSPERAKLLLGMFEYRKSIRALGFVKGFQWIDGSFAEDVEKSQGRAPNDIDLITFTYQPNGFDNEQVNKVMVDNPDIFDRSRAKYKFGCDTFIGPLGLSPESLVKRTAYYFQLFSHRKDDQVWKGFIQIPLEADSVLTENMLRSSDLGGQDAPTT
jgi:hypothetical protein